MKVWRQFHDFNSKLIPVALKTPLRSKFANWSERRSSLTSMRISCPYPVASAVTIDEEYYRLFHGLKDDFLRSIASKYGWSRNWSIDNTSATRMLYYLLSKFAGLQAELSSLLRVPSFNSSRHHIIYRVSAACKSVVENVVTNIALCTELLETSNRNF